MGRVSRLVLLSVLALLLGSALATDFATNQFVDWYPEYGTIFKTILSTHCQSQYDKYLTGKRNATYQADDTGGQPGNQIIEPVVNCILTNTSEFIKAAMANAGVLLGVAPTILGFLGNSAGETAALSVLARRPFLAFALATASPATLQLRTFEYQDPFEVLKEIQGRIRLPKFSPHCQLALMVFEWLLVIGAIANVVTVALQLGSRTILTFAPAITFLPLVWGLVGIIIHICGTLAFHCRARVEPGDNAGPEDHSILRFVSSEINLPMRRRPFKVSLRNENYFFLFFSWWTSTLTVFHLLLGTLIFSSFLFITVRDAIQVIARLMGSAMACRAILMYELAVLRASYNTTKGNVEKETGSEKESAVEQVSPLLTVLDYFQKTWPVGAVKTV